MTYYDLPARNQKYGERLSEFIPSYMASWLAHCDPNFTDYNYAEPERDEPKQNAIKTLDIGDFIYFISSLVPYNSTVYLRKDSGFRQYQQGKMNKYVTGFFEVEALGIVNVNKKNISIEKLVGNLSESDVRNNEHFKRLPMINGNKTISSDGFVLVKGNPDHSALLCFAIPITEGQTSTPRGGHTFRLNNLGLFIRHRDTDSLRGFRLLENEAIRVMGQKIVESNPELEPKLKHLF
jgi:hypothetical protein